MKYRLVPMDFKIGTQGAFGTTTTQYGCAIHEEQGTLIATALAQTRREAKRRAAVIRDALLHDDAIRARAELADLRQSVSDAYHREQGVQIQNDALRAEVERLREALDDFHDAVCDACESCDPHPPTKPWATETQAIDACMRAAVAAGDALRLNAAKEEA